MAGLTQALQQQVLEDVFLDTDLIGWSTDGAAEFAGLSRTEISWGPASAASPSVKATDADLLSAEATQAGAVSHFAVFSVGGTRLTDWKALASPRTLAVGDRLSADAGAFFATMD